MSEIKNVGIFGGSFNPLHQGHLIVAEFAAESMNLDLVLFTPVVFPPHKESHDLIPIEHRIAMIEPAIANNERFQLSRADVDRPGPHYSVDTVSIIQADYPHSNLYFVMGGDSFKTFPRWHQPEAIIRICHLAVMRRPSSRPVQRNMHEVDMPGLEQRTHMIEAPPIGISSTRIREQVQVGKSVRYLVPDNVLHYIHTHHLYQGGGAS